MLLYKKNEANPAPSGQPDPYMIEENDFVEGTGHNSVIRRNGKWWIIYHGRDIVGSAGDEYVEARTARVCKLHVKDGVITAERYYDKV